MSSKFILFTDTHLTADERPLLDLNPLERLRNAVEHAAIHHPDALFAILTGDLADAGEVRAYEDLKKVAGHLPYPSWLALGNHDDRNHFKQVFSGVNASYRGKFVQYVFVAGGVSHIVLDTLEPGCSKGILCAERLLWLKDAIENASTQSIMLYLHHPPCDSGIAEMDRCKLSNAAELAQVLRPHRERILQMFHGHLHRNVHSLFERIPVCGSKSTVHTIALRMEAGAPLSVSTEPPEYTVVRFNSAQVLIHHQGFLHNESFTQIP